MISPKRRLTEKERGNQKYLLEVKGCTQEGLFSASVAEIRWMW